MPRGVEQLVHHPVPGRFQDPSALPEHCDEVGDQIKHLPVEDDVSRFGTSRELISESNAKGQLTAIAWHLHALTGRRLKAWRGINREHSLREATLQLDCLTPLT